MQDRDRHLCAVMRGGHDARGDVVGRVVAGWNLLAFTQYARTRRHVVIIDFRRRRHRRIGESQIGGLEFVAAHGVKRIGGLVEGNGVLFAALEVADDDRGQRVGALQPDHVAGIELDIEHIDALAVWNQVAPIGALGRGERRADDLEVDGAIRIGENEQFITAIGERILHALFARGDEARGRFGMLEIDQPLLGGFMVTSGDHAEAAGRTLMQMGEPAGILLFIDKRIVSLFRAKPMPPHLHRTVVVVELDIEEAVAVLAPDDPAVGLFDQVVTIRPGAPVAYADREILGTLGVGAPPLQLVIRRMPRAAELEVLMVLGQLVAIEHDFYIAAIARRAPEQFMLSAFAEFSQIGERAVRRGHAGIVFLDSPAHFRNQLLLQGRGVAEQSLSVVVLGFQIFSDTRFQDRGIAQHFLPSGVFQPCVIVGHRDAVRGEGMRTARRDGGCLCHSGLVPCAAGLPRTRYIRWNARRSRLIRRVGKAQRAHHLSAISPGRVGTLRFAHPTILS